METIKDLEQILEALLFTSGRPLKAKELAKVLEIDESQVTQSLTSLAQNTGERGIILLESVEGFQLATNSKYSTQVKNFLNAELREKLTDATVEVLAIIAYRQPISKAEIEAIRGVNSQYSLRNLLMRGMIEKVANPNDARSVCYQTTTEFLMHMGLASTKELPEFEKLVEQIKLPETPALSQEQTAQEQVIQAEPTAITTEPSPELPVIQDSEFPSHATAEQIETPTEITENLENTQSESVASVGNEDAGEDEDFEDEEDEEDEDDDEE